MRWNQRQEDTADEQRMRGIIEELERRLSESGESIERLASEIDAAKQDADLLESYRKAGKSERDRAEKAEARVAKLEGFNSRAADKMQELCRELDASKKPRPMREAPRGVTLWCTGRHLHAFRSGQRSQVVGVGATAPKGCIARPVLRVRFDDGVEDLVPLAGTQGENPDWELDCEAK